MKLKNMYGKQVRGIERSTFVIGADGKLAHAWRGVRVPQHVDEVLAFVQTLS
jgi:peroxiredoxin Q/BCP